MIRKEIGAILSNLENAGRGLRRLFFCLEGGDVHTHKFLAAISRAAHAGVVHLEDAAFLVRHHEAVSARFDHSPILGLATAKAFFGLLSHFLLVQIVHGEGDRVGDFLKQADLPVLEDVLFSGVDDEHAANLSPKTKRQGGCRAEAMGDRTFPPGVAPGGRPRSRE